MDRDERDDSQLRRKEAVMPGSNGWKFASAIEQVANLKGVARRPGWAPLARLDNVAGVLQVRNADQTRPYVATEVDVTADDWEIYLGDPFARGLPAPGVPRVRRWEPQGSCQERDGQDETEPADSAAPDRHQVAVNALLDVFTLAAVKNDAGLLAAAAAAWNALVR